MYWKRTIERYLSSVSRQFPVVLVTGARQVGKTTVLERLSRRNRTYVTLDDPRVLSVAREDPALFFERFSPPLLIDEIQYAPHLLSYIKMRVDRDRKPGQFWLTGSQQFHLMKHVSESLAGRVGIVSLLGLSRAELERRPETSKPFVPEPAAKSNGTAARKPSLQEVYRRIWRGSFPAIALHPRVDRDLFYGSYIQTYLQRDVHELARVGDQAAFFRFLRASAARTGQMLNMTDLSRDAGVAPNTAKSWLSILQASGMVYLLEPYHSNLTKRLVRTPKQYWLDTGLCAYLTEWNSPQTLEAGAMSGAILETWIIGELLKSYWHNGLRAPFYYYRDKDQKEIDLLVVRDGTAWPVEIKKTASPTSDDVRHFSVLDALKMPIGPGGVICLCGESLPLSKQVRSIPIGEI
ncbi:MAG: ATP-binding protein [Phycisphaerae bacterium]|nr:ATP-binding protein [Phycisphaerae bacterium]